MNPIYLQSIAVVQVSRWLSISLPALAALYYGFSKQRGDCKANRWWTFIRVIANARTLASPLTLPKIC